MRIPTFKCKTGCSECCGVVPFHYTEWEKVKHLANRMDCTVKNFDARECFVYIDQKFQCGFLNKGKCSIYDQRPLICKMFGAVDHPFLTCSYGCGPKKKIKYSDSIRELFNVHIRK